MGHRRLARVASALWGAGALLAAAGVASAGPTNVQQDSGLVWVMIAISIAGAALTWGVMAYALWRYRDPATLRRRYG